MSSRIDIQSLNSTSPVKTVTQTLSVPAATESAKIPAKPRTASLSANTNINTNNTNNNNNNNNNNTTSKTSTTTSSSASSLSPTGSISSQKRNHHNASSSSLNDTSNAPKKKHRPSSLNLRVGVPDSTSDVALRIVSPGLPPLKNKGMKTTVQLLQKIQKQQKNLIAARHGLEITTAEVQVQLQVPEQQSSSNNSNNQAQKQKQGHHNVSQLLRIENVLNAEEPPIKSPIYSLDDSDLSRLSTLREKRLKRNNIPAPLNIGRLSNRNRGNSKEHQNIQPLIQSAPIRPMNRTSTRLFSNRVAYQQQPYQFQHPQQQVPLQYQQYQQYPRPIPATAYQPVFTPLNSRTIYQFNNAQVMHNNFRAPVPPPTMMQQRVRMVPVTSATLAQFPSARHASLPVPPLQTHSYLHPQSLPHNPQQPLQQPLQQHTQSGYQPQNQNQNPTRGQRATSAVTDVFSDNLQRAAPIESQPLSSQRELWRQNRGESYDYGDDDSNDDDGGDGVENNGIDANEDDDESITEEEIREMQMKYEASNMRNATLEFAPPPPPPSLYHSYLNVYPASASARQQNFPMSLNIGRFRRTGNNNGTNSSIHRDEVFGSINFMNENIFNFRIFEKRRSDDDEATSSPSLHSASSKSSDGDESEVDDSEKIPSTSTSATSTSATVLSEVAKEDDLPTTETTEVADGSEEVKVKEDANGASTIKQETGNDTEKQSVVVLEADAKLEQKDDTISTSQPATAATAAAATVAAATTLPPSPTPPPPSSSSSSSFTTTKNNTNSSNSTSSSHWLTKEKEKFLKICETCWDEFVKSRIE